MRGERERNPVSHISRNGAGEWDQTPTQAGPSRQPYTYSEATPRAARPARELVYQAPAIPSRHASCELCAIVEQCRLEGAGRTSSWERRKVKGRDVVFADERITVYEAQGKERVTRPGRHLMLVINIHAESVYQFVSSSVLINRKCRYLQYH